MTDWTAEVTASRRYPMLLLAVLAGLALVLAAVGLYGVLAYFVGERTREIGVRRALGAPKGSVVKLVLGQGARLVGIGLVIGGLSAIWGTRFLRGLLYEIGTGDPGAIAGAVVVLALVGLGASLLPALRAARVDPAVTLRGRIGDGRRADGHGHACFERARPSARRPLAYFGGWTTSVIRLVGAALAGCGLRRRTRYATAALVLGANLPDIDVLALFGDNGLGLPARDHARYSGPDRVAVRADRDLLLAWDRLVARARAA